MTSPVTRTDWKIFPLPEKRAHLEISRAFTDEQMERIRQGLKPKDMDDRWFIYFEKTVSISTVVGQVIASTSPIFGMNRASGTLPTPMPAATRSNTLRRTTKPTPAPLPH
jgi:hypothetical protein